MEFFRFLRRESEENIRRTDLIHFKKVGRTSVYSTVVQHTECIPAEMRICFRITSFNGPRKARH